MRWKAPERMDRVEPDAWMVLIKWLARPGILVSLLTSGLLNQVVTDLTIGMLEWDKLICFYMDFNF